MIPTPNETSGAGGRPISSAQATMIGIALAIGIGLRLRVYLANRSLWLDESFLANNLVERDFYGLTLPLAYNQVAPLGFLFLEGLLVVLFGTSEYALRAGPLVAGIVALFLFWRLTSALMLPIGVLMGTAVFALSGQLIYYATEVKQYGVDVAVTLMLWILFVRLEPGLRKDRLGAWAAAAIVGALALWVSHPAVFILGGIGLRWLWHTVYPFSGNWRSVFVRGPVGLIWAGSFALSYVIALRRVADTTLMYERWESAAAPIVPESFADLRWYVALVWTLAQAPSGPAVAKAVALVCGAGVVALWCRHRDRFWWAAGALALAVLASALGHYPLSMRLWVFLAPITILTLSLAIEEVWRRTHHRLRPLAPALAVAMLVPSVVTATSLAVSPPGKEEIRPVLQHVREHYRAGDRLYLYASARSPATYYAARGLGFPGEVVIAERGWGDRSVYERDAERLRGQGRTWVVFSHVRRFRGLNEEALILGVLDEMGVRLAERRETGASVYLYDL